MLQTIENEHLLCTIESSGAEVRSLIDKQTGKEYIWQIDPRVWGSSAPVLFPAIGKIKDDHITHQGRRYAMPKHGIVRNNDTLKFEQSIDNSVSFTLTDSAATIVQYPYKFEFTVSFTLVKNRLLMTYSITNQDTQPLAFTCGGHTAYACPLSEDTSLTDYLVEFPSEISLEATRLGASGLLSDQKETIAAKSALLPLSDTLFNKDALIFTKIQADWVRLRKRNEKKGVVVHFKGYPHLALWSKPKADYLCIEPWLGLPDREDESLEITKKSTYESIAPGAQFIIAIETEIE